MKSYTTTLLVIWLTILQVSASTLVGPAQAVYLYIAYTFEYRSNHDPTSGNIAPGCAQAKSDKTLCSLNEFLLFIEDTSIQNHWISAIPSNGLTNGAFDPNLAMTELYKAGYTGYYKIAKVLPNNANTATYRDLFSGVMNAVVNFPTGAAGAGIPVPDISPLTNQWDIVALARRSNGAQAVVGAVNRALSNAGKNLVAHTKTTPGLAYIPDFQELDSDQTLQAANAGLGGAGAITGLALIMKDYKDSIEKAEAKPPNLSSEGFARGAQMVQNFAVKMRPFNCA